MRSLLIPTAGKVADSPAEPGTLARAALNTDQLDVVMARALGRDRVYVLHIDDWGKTKGLPINRRAWALYGGSPIYGTAVLSADDGGPIDEALIELISSDFPPPEVHVTMDLWLEVHGDE